MDLSQRGGLETGAEGGQGASRVAVAIGPLERACPCSFQLRVSGESEGAILEGVQENSEYQISLSALYGDGAQSEAVAIRYSTCE